VKVQVVHQVVDRTASGRVVSLMEGKVIDVADDDTELVDLLRGYEARGDVVIGDTEKAVGSAAADAAEAEHAAAVERAEAAGIPAPPEPEPEPDKAETVAPDKPETKTPVKATGRKVAG
jgi:hypothetical protein